MFTLASTCLAGSSRRLLPAVPLPFTVRTVHRRANGRGPPSHDYGFYTPPPLPPPRSTIEPTGPLSPITNALNLTRQTLPFAISGRGALPGKAKRLWYLDKSLPLPFVPQICSQLYNDIERSKGQHRSDGAKQRVATLSPASYAFNVDPLLGLSVLPAVEQRLGLRGLYAVPTGLHVTRHSVLGSNTFNTYNLIPAANMVGMVAVCLPTRFTGGEITLTHPSGVQVFRWQPQRGQLESKTRCTWVFFRGATAKLHATTEGFRVLAIYGIYSHDNLPVATESWSNTMTEVDEGGSFVSSFQERFVDALSNPTLLPDGGTIGFELVHDYLDFADASHKLIDLEDLLIGKGMATTAVQHTEAGDVTPRGVDFWVRRALQLLGLRVRVSGITRKNDEPVDDADWGVGPITWAVPPQPRRIVSPDPHERRSFHNRFTTLAMFVTVPKYSERKGMQARLAEAQEAEQAEPEVEEDEAEAQAAAQGAAAARATD